MFNGSKKLETIRTDRIDTIIGEEAIFEGILKTQDTTRIDGTVKGEVRSEGILIIGESGLVEGNVFTQAILVAGTIQGNLKAAERTEVARTGRIIGDVVTKTLVIEEGAAFEGKCEMEKKQLPPQKTSSASNIENSEKVGAYEDQGETVSKETQERDNQLSETDS